MSKKRPYNRKQEREQDRMDRMDNWRTLKLKGVTDIEQVVGFYYVWSLKQFPYGKVRVKIVENQSGRYRGTADMGVKRASDGEPEWISVEGQNIEDTLAKTVQRLLASIEQQQATEETDFVWMDARDF